MTFDVLLCLELVNKFLVGWVVVWKPSLVFSLAQAEYQIFHFCECLKHLIYLVLDNITSKYQNKAVAPMSHQSV